MRSVRKSIWTGREGKGIRGVRSVRTGREGKGI